MQRTAIKHVKLWITLATFAYKLIQLYMDRGSTTDNAVVLLPQEQKTTHCIPNYQQFHLPSCFPSRLSLDRRLFDGALNSLGAMELASILRGRKHQEFYVTVASKMLIGSHKEHLRIWYSTSVPNKCNT